MPTSEDKVETRVPSRDLNSSPADSVKDDEQHFRLLIVANRLPITIKKRPDVRNPFNWLSMLTRGKGEYKYTISEGGLATALSGLKKTMSFIWIGWTGISPGLDFIELTC